MAQNFKNSAPGPFDMLKPKFQAYTDVPQKALPVHEFSHPEPRTFLLPSSGAQNQFFVFGNVIVNAQEDNTQLKSDLIKAKNDIKHAFQSLNDYIQKYSE